MPKITILYSAPTESQEYDVPRNGFTGKLVTKIVKDFSEDAYGGATKETKVVSKYWQF